MNAPLPCPDPVMGRDPGLEQIVVALTDLCRSPGGARDRQLLFGDHVNRLSNDTDGWCRVQAAKDGYRGFVRSDSLGTAVQATHRIAAQATHAYARPDIKSPDTISLSFGSRVIVEGTSGNFAQTALGFIPLRHLVPVACNDSDPATVAALFLGTPYLWGGNSRWGIDCSGLVQAALLACGVTCPGDSSQQRTVGTAAPAGRYQRNDLLFWKGHVALVCDSTTMIHANAHAMAVTVEPIDAALARIADQGGGALLTHNRLPLLLAENIPAGGIKPLPA